MASQMLQRPRGVPSGFDTQEVSGSLNRNNSGGPELTGGSGRRQAG